MLLRLERSRNFGHSLAEALHHHKAQVVVQGILGFLQGFFDGEVLRARVWRVARERLYRRW